MQSNVKFLPYVLDRRGSELNPEVYETVEPVVASNRVLHGNGGKVEAVILQNNPAIADVTDIALGYSTYGRDFNKYIPDFYTPTAGRFDARKIDMSDLSYFDLNGDGLRDQFVFKGNRSSVTKEVEVTKVTPVEWVPTSESAQVLIGKGDVSTTWVLRKEDTHTTAESYESNWNVNLSVTAKGTPFGIGAETTASFGGGGSNTTTETNSFTVANETRQSYTIPAGKYEEGTVVRYGYHVLKGKVELTEEVVSLFQIANAKDGYADMLFLTADTKSTLNNYGLDLLLTDYDVSAQPDFGQVSYDGFLA